MHFHTVTFVMKLPAELGLTPVLTLQLFPSSMGKKRIGIRKMTSQEKVNNIIVEQSSD